MQQDEAGSNGANRQDVELRVINDVLELWWVNTERLSEEEVPQDQSDISTRLVQESQQEVRVGVMTGVYYRDDRHELEGDFQTEDVMYEVLVEADEEHEAKMRIFFGFATDESLLFEVLADEVWALSSSAMMAAKYEMHDFIETQEWSEYVLEEDKLQEIMFFGCGAGSDDESKGYWLAVILKKSIIMCRLKETLEAIQQLQGLWRQGSNTESESFVRMETLLVKELPAGSIFDEEVSELIHWRVQGSVGVKAENAKLVTWWLLWSAGETRWLSEKHAAFKARRQVVSFCHSMDEYITWHVTKFKVSPSKVTKINRRNNPMLSPVPFATSDDAKRMERTGGKANETYEMFLQSCDGLVEDKSGVLRPAEIMQYSIQDECDQALVRFWCGVKTVDKKQVYCYQKELSDTNTVVARKTRLLVKFWYNKDAEIEDAGEEVMEQTLKIWGAAQWVRECSSPSKVVGVLYRIFIKRMQAIFREWYVVTHVQVGQWRLYMASDVWKICAEMSIVSDSHMRVMWPNAETSIVDMKRLIPWSGSELLRGIPTTHQDFRDAGVSLPRRLLSLDSIETPGTKVIDELFADWDVIEKEMSLLLQSQESGESTENVVLSPMAVEQPVVFDHLYLHDDFHWRPCQMLTHCISAVGVSARVQLAEYRMEVPLTRLKDLVLEQCDAIAAKDDYTVRGIQLPYGYFVECLRTENIRKNSQREAKSAWQVWQQMVRESQTQVRKTPIRRDTWPEAVLMSRNSDVLHCRGDDDLKVVQLVRCGEESRYVCVSGSTISMCDADKVPSLMESRVAEYDRWHVMITGKTAKEWKCKQAEEASEDSDEDFKDSGSESEEGDAVSQQKADQMAADDELRKPANLLKEKLSCEKLGTESCVGAVVTRLIEVEPKSGKVLYREYEVTLKDGTNRRLSKKAGMNKRVQEMVKDYEEWHVLHVGVSAETLLKDAVIEVEELDEKDVWARGGDGIVTDEEEDSDDEEVDETSDVELCRKECDRLLHEMGLESFAEVKPLSLWSEEEIRDFVRLKTKACAPKVSKEVAEIVGCRGMLYSSRATEAERLVMQKDERLAASFGFAAVVTGEAWDSTTQNIKVSVRDAEKDEIFSIRLEHVFYALSTAAKTVKDDMMVERVMVLVKDVSILEQYSGLNFCKQSYAEYLRLTGDNARVSSPARSGASAADWDKAMSAMMSQKGRDFIEEAELIRDREESGEAASLRKTAVSKQTATLRAEQDRVRIATTQDQRKTLSSEDIMRGRERCAVVLCEGILENRESECNICECQRLRFCVCSECYVPYDPNRHKKCSTSGCKRYFSHHPQYDRQVERDEKYELKQSLETKEKTKKLLTQKTNNTRLKKLLQDSRGKPSVQVRDETNSTEMFTTIALMSTTAAENEDEQLPPLKKLTCGLDFDMLTKISKAEYGSFSKNRLSVWQCLRLKGEWQSKWYYNHRLTSSDNMMTAAEFEKIKNNTLELKDFKEACRNLCLIVTDWGNSYKAEEIEVMTDILETWFKALKPKSRSKYATVVLLMDLVDMMMDMGTSYMTELANTIKDKRDVSVVYDLMHANFPELDFTVATMHQCPPMVIRELCEAHGTGELLASEWPENKWSCECTWQKKIASALKDFEDEPLPVTALARSRRGISKVGALNSTEDALWQSEEVGGFNDKVRADSEQDRVKHCKLSFKVFSNKHIQIAHNELKANLSGKLPEGQTPCMNWGTWEGCNRGEECEHSHGWRNLITRDELEGLKMYHAWCRARKDGLYFNDNEDRMEWNALSKKKKTEKLRDWVTAKMREAGYGPRASPDVTADPGTEAATTRTTRSSTRRSTATGAATKTFSQPITAAQAAQVAKCKPKIGGGQTEAGRVWTAQRAPRWSSSQLKTVYESVEVAKEQMVDNGVTLMGSGVQISKTEMLPDTWPYDHLGTVKITDMWKLTIECKHVETVGSLKLVFYVCDCGENIGTEVRCCETLATVAAFRAKVSPAEGKEQLRAAADKWFTKHGTDKAGKAPTWATVFASMHRSEVSTEVLGMQADVVDSIQSRSQPCSSEQGAMLMQDFADGVIECKIYHDAHDQISFSNSIPRSCLDDDGCIMDVPVVFKYYTPSHACAAVCISIQQNTEVFQPKENWQVMQTQQWQGVKAHSLLEMFPKWQGHMDVQYFAASTVEQVLAGVPGNYPSWVRQMIVDGQCGGKEDSAKKSKAGAEVSWEHRVSWLVGETMTSHKSLSEKQGTQWMQNTKIKSAQNTEQSTERLWELEESPDLVSEDESEDECDEVYMVSSSQEEVMTDWDEGATVKTKKVGENSQQAQKGSWRQLVHKSTQKENMQSTDREIKLLRQTALAHHLMKMWMKKEELMEQLVERDTEVKDEAWQSERMLLLVSEMTEVVAGEHSTINGEEEDLVHLMGCLNEMRGTSEDMKKLVGGSVTEAASLTREDAELMCVQAYCCLVKHRQTAMTQLQDSPDPGQEWLVKQGELMETAVTWMIRAYPDMLPEDQMQKIEEFLREIEHVGRPSKSMNAQVLHTHCADLPEELRDTLKQTMEHGVLTGIPKPEKTNRAKSSMAAMQHKEKVWKNLRKFALHGWVRVFPASMWHIVEKMCLRISATHYVPDQDRLVADLSNAGQKSVGEDANTLSDGSSYTKDQVQCDYVETVIEEMFSYLLELDMFSDEDLVSIKADIKSAFMRIPLDVRSVGSLAIEWEGWIFVFSRTPFGWKYATHTFSHFTTAIKHKVARFNKNGWQNDAEHAQRVNWSRVSARLALLNVLPEKWKGEAVRRWRDYLVFAYVDDLWAHTEDMKRRTRRMADVLRIAGYLLLGYDCWSLKKAKLDGFCSLMHKYTGMIYNMHAKPEPTVSFTADRIAKNLDLCVTAKNWKTKWPLGFAQTIHGNQVWVFRVYQILKGMASGWRRCTQGVLTAEAKPDTWVTPGRVGENELKAAKKHHKDNDMLIQCFQYLKSVKEHSGEGAGADAVPISALIPHTHQNKKWLTVV